MDENETTELLREWLTWYMTTEEAPAKMPNALHVRTAVHLARVDYQLPDLVSASPLFTLVDTE